MQERNRRYDEREKERKNADFLGRVELERERERAGLERVCEWRTGESHAELREI